MKTLILTFALVILLCCLCIGSALAQTRVPGVSAGNDFHYTGYVVSVSNPSNKTVYPGIFQYQIDKIDGSWVYFYGVQDYLNGTIIRHLGWVNVQTGEFGGTAYIGFEVGGSTNGNVFLWSFVAANLNAGDPVYDGYTSSFNETIYRSYLSGNRATNHYISSMGGDTLEMYFDKQTGIMVEYAVTDLNSGIKQITAIENSSFSSTSNATPSPSSPTSTSTPTLSPTPTPSPSIPELPSWIILASIVIATLAVSVYLKKIKTQ